jgi:hypothetical protein
MLEANTVEGVAYFAGQLRADGRIGGKRLGVRTVRRIHSALHAAPAQRWSSVFDNVADQAADQLG